MGIHRALLKIRFCICNLLESIGAMKLMHSVYFLAFIVMMILIIFGLELALIWQG